MINPHTKGDYHEEKTLTNCIGANDNLGFGLGRKHLYVDDDAGESRPAERLSGGTREQMFLAIRLAMVKAFSNNGIELPMVLDDVTVNFDEHRSEAAVTTLMDFTKEGVKSSSFTRTSWAGGYYHSIRTL